VTSAALPLHALAGFEASGYARLDGRIVWQGEGAGAAHPRNARQPWQAAPMRHDAQQLQRGAQRCLSLIEGLPAKGLLLWLAGQPLPFPLDLASARFDAIGAALQGHDVQAFETAALRVIGLGPGLTPSGDDFVGAILFALAHAPRTDWPSGLPAVKARLAGAAAQRSNAISAALLDDAMAGTSFRALHEMLLALHSERGPAITRAAQALLCVGASSGADMLAGLLLALHTRPDLQPLAP